MGYRVELNDDISPLDPNDFAPFETVFPTYGEAIHKSVFNAARRWLKNPMLGDGWLDAAACGVIVAAVRGSDWLAHGSMDEWLRILCVEVVPA